MEQFDDIRPYSDQEVRPILDRLLQDQQLLSALVHFSYPSLAMSLGGFLRPLTRFLLQRKLAGISDVRGLQHVIAPYIERVVKKTTSDVTWTGLDALEPGQSYLFLSNHRDIVMDSAFVNYGLYNRGMETMRVAIGDNLLSRPYVSDLMRLNKSFIVKRSLVSLREKLGAYQKLSAFVNHSIETGHSVWIAHREGRAKDGDDRTDSAIIKMLYMSQKGKGHSLGEVMGRLRIVPVSVAYEYDPCDQRKANELQVRSDQGNYDKATDEDLQSIATGIEGWKGHVHVSFGQPLAAEFDSAVDVAREVDRQIHTLYHLHPSNYIAHDLLCEHQGGQKIAGWEQQFSGIDLDEKRSAFSERLNACSPASQDWFLKIYANPVINHYRDLSS
ncbi:1-acyl-sn-glycerol-3-phosphate acyltransferase [Kistimonas asteriae]|uniref:1-acyl-sn-glycerol-3-phosphate acyltransferase n=1 Tax=Kistimonas asteriae TaxID=517724 RepID=UPI001FEA1910|nr:1-acyl-sn-glycerol-3-phosphate acyltransferase [Kistimonas asteriae]